MATKFAGVANDAIVVWFASATLTVIVTDSKNARNKIFAGWDSISEAWDIFQNSFSDHITFEDAIRFFTPTIGQTIINAR